MPDRQPIKMIDVRTAMGPGELGPFAWDQYGRRCLAQGDSWFSIGALPPQFTTNLLLEMRLARNTVITQCARPGKVLRRFTDTTREQDFLRMIKGPLAWRWHAILISGVGNDLIDAVGSPPSAAPALRLLRTPAERGAGSRPAAEHISEPGWQTFATHIRAVFNALVDLRDSGVNARVPMVMHNYARLMPRPAPAGPLSGPWLHPAFEAFAVPQDDRLAVSDELTGRTSQLLTDMIAERRSTDPNCNLHLVDTLSGAGVTLAEPGTSGTSGDWANEIHLTPAGYRKCTKLWADVLDPILG